MVSTSQCFNLKFTHFVTIVEAKMKMFLSVFAIFIVNGIGMRQLTEELMSQSFDYLSQTEAVQASKVSKSLYQVWRYHNRQVLLDIAFLDDLIMRINDTLFDDTTIRKLQDNHIKYSRNFNIIYLTKSANWIQKNDNLFRERTSNHVQALNIQRILKIVIPENVRNFKQLRNKFATSTELHPFNKIQTIAFKALYHSLSYSVPFNWSETLQSQWSRDFNLIMDCSENLKGKEYVEYIQPSLSANIENIVFQSHSEPRVNEKVTVKLRCRYIIHFLKAIPIHSNSTDLSDISVVDEIKDIMKELKFWKIDDMLEMVRDELIRHRDERAFDFPEMDFLVLYQQKTTPR